MEEAMFNPPSWMGDPCWQTIFITFVWVFMIVGVVWLLYSAYEKENQ